MATAWEDVGNYARTDQPFWLCAEHIFIAPPPTGPGLLGVDVPSPAERVLATPHSGIRRMIDIAVQTPSPIMLLGGDPNFTTPDHIIEGAAAAARAGATGYAPGGGIPALREATSRRCATATATLLVEQVVVTTGGCGGLFTSLMLMLDPGSEVLIPDPGWSNYPAMAHVLNAVAVGYPLDRGRDMRVDAGALERLVTDRTRAVIVNSPGNPRGRRAAANLRAVLDLAERHDLWVISDECYDELIFEGPHVDGGARRRGARDHRVHVLEVLRDDGLAGRLRRGAAVVRGAALARPGTGRLLRLDDLPARRADRASRPAGLRQEMGDAYRDRRDIAVGDSTGRGVVRATAGGSS